jgi:hypothetical protein
LCDAKSARARDLRRAAPTDGASASRARGYEVSMRIARDPRTTREAAPLLRLRAHDAIVAHAREVISRIHRRAPARRTRRRRARLPRFFSRQVVDSEKNRD